MGNTSSSKGKLVSSLLVAIYTFNFAVILNSAEDKKSLLADLDSLGKACESFASPDFDRLNVEKLEASLKEIWPLPPIIDKVEQLATKTKDPFIRANLLMSLGATKLGCHTRFAFHVVNVIKNSPLDRKGIVLEQVLEASNKSLLSSAPEEISGHIFLLLTLGSNNILRISENELKQLNSLFKDIGEKSIEKTEKIKKLITSKSLSNEALDKLASTEKLYISNFLNKNQDFLKKLSKQR